MKGNPTPLQSTRCVPGSSFHIEMSNTNSPAASNSAVTGGCGSGICGHEGVTRVGCPNQPTDNAEHEVRARVQGPHREVEHELACLGSSLQRCRVQGSGLKGREMERGWIEGSGFKTGSRNGAGVDGAAAAWPTALRCRLWVAKWRCIYIYIYIYIYIIYVYMYTYIKTGSRNGGAGCQVGCPNVYHSGWLAIHEFARCVCGTNFIISHGMIKGKGLQFSGKKIVCGVDPSTLE